MGNDRDYKLETDDYHFMRETIKKKPVDKRIACKRFATIIGGGIIFGACAAIALVVASPILAEKATEDTEPVKISSARSSLVQTSESGVTADDLAIADGTTEIERYEGIYKEVLQISEEPRKALVSVSGVSKDADLLGTPLTEYDDTEGIIFLENNSFLYILTDGTDFDEADTLQVTFSDESIIEGHLCETDKETGLSVISVALKDISQKTLSAISVAELGDSYSVEQASSVIAIGSPAGERDAVMYGVVTSVSGKLSVSDAEYSLITTDIHGSGKSQGFLLDTSGKIVGLLVNPSGNESGYLRALAISQLCPLIERLSNGETSSYIGIHGITINSAKAAARSMPEGIYVESVDRDSPAMTAGIQNGDIITSLNGYTVKSVRTYMTYLQRLDAGDRVSITFSRVNLEGEYISMESTVIIKEK